jgi:hypothetical protein
MDLEGDGAGMPAAAGGGVPVRSLDAAAAAFLSGVLSAGQKHAATYYDSHRSLARTITLRVLCSGTCKAAIRTARFTQRTCTN